MAVRLSLLSLVAAGLLLGCGHPTRRYESACQIIRTEVIEVDDKGKPSLFEVEVEWDPCPGEQYQVIRGGAAFAECMKQHRVGDLVSVHVDHFWDSRGYYRWDLTRVGACKRPIEVDAEGSYEKSQECRDIDHHGKKVGFICNRKPFKDLVNVCPWMARD